MRGLQRSKRVSWASDVNLCQVRLFLLEESPSQVGLDAQDHLQAKASWPLHSPGMGSDDNLPPGFEGAHPENLLKNKLSQIPLIKWTCPSRFVLDFTWQVVAGEESKEVEVQNQREMRVLEAVYPRPSAIPPNPSVLPGVEDSHYNDQDPPLIPITPIEDEDSATDTPFDDSLAPNTMISPGIPSSSQCIATNYLNPPANGNLPAGMALGVEPDAAVAAYAALSAVMTSNDQRNLIDSDLIVKILSDPKLIEKLVTDHQAATNPHITPTPSSQGMTLSIASGPFYPPPNMVGPVSNPRPPAPEVAPVLSPPSEAPVANDINYYRSLIQQHGGERQETLLPQFGSHHNHQLVANLDSQNNPKPRDLKPKIMKPCVYFNSSRGCRHGANCSYLHEASAPQRANNMPEVQSTKRMKVEREITGT